MTMIVAGGCAVSMVPTYLDLANELTFPMQPAVANGVMILSGQVVGTVLGAYGTYITTVTSDETTGLSGEEVSEFKAWYSLRALIMLTSCTVMASFVNFIVEEDLRRLKYESYCRKQSKNMGHLKPS
jgi:hypothetical protein